MTSTPKHTPLYQWHKQNGANMGIFAGYEMPLWYPSGAKKEHISVITRAGLFDTSHMAVIILKGPGALDLLQYLFSKDLTRWNNTPDLPMPEGRCVYGILLDSFGGVMDDALLYRISTDTFMIVVNAGMGEKISEHFNAHKKDHLVEIQNLTDQVAKIDVQGPLSAKLLAGQIQNSENILSNLSYFGFRGYLDKFMTSSDPVLLRDGTRVLLSRTGYTGELGFELFFDYTLLETVWQGLLEAGAPFNLQPCGLAARDSLRTGALLPLSHQDIGPWLYLRNPWVFALPYIKGKTKFSKKFIASEALEKGKETDYTIPFAGFDLRKIMPERGSVFYPPGNKIGTVLTCVTDMAISRVNNRIYSMGSPDKPADFSPRGLCCGYVKVNTFLQIGTIITLADDRRRIEVMITDNIRPHGTARVRI